MYPHSKKPSPWQQFWRLLIMWCLQTCSVSSTNSTSLNNTSSTISTHRHTHMHTHTCTHTTLVNKAFNFKEPDMYLLVYKLKICEGAQEKRTYSVKKWSLIFCCRHPLSSCIVLLGSMGVLMAVTIPVCKNKHIQPNDRHFQAVVSCEHNSFLIKFLATRLLFWS